MSTPSATSSSAIDVESLLVEYDASGQTAAAFARAKGIAAWKLYAALRRRSGRRRARRSADRAAGAEQFVPVRVTAPEAHSSAVPLELLLRGGHRLLIGADFDARLLRRVLEALGPC
jgi:hypothetical protein